MPWSLSPAILVSLSALAPSTFPTPPSAFVYLPSVLGTPLTAEINAWRPPPKTGLNYCHYQTGDSGRYTQPCSSVRGNDSMRPPLAIRPPRQLRPRFAAAVVVGCLLISLLPPAAIADCGPGSPPDCTCIVLEHSFLPEPLVLQPFVQPVLPLLTAPVYAPSETLTGTLTATLISSGTLVVNGMGTLHLTAPEVVQNLATISAVNPTQFASWNTELYALNNTLISSTFNNITLNTAQLINLPPVYQSSGVLSYSEVSSGVLSFSLGSSGVLTTYAHQFLSPVSLPELTNGIIPEPASLWLAILAAPAIRRFRRSRSTVNV